MASLYEAFLEASSNFEGVPCRDRHARCFEAMGFGRCDGDADCEQRLLRMYQRAFTILVNDVGRMMHGNDGWNQLEYGEDIDAYLEAAEPVLDRVMQLWSAEPYVEDRLRFLSATLGHCMDEADEDLLTRLLGPASA